MILPLLVFPGSGHKQSKWTGKAGRWADKAEGPVWIDVPDLTACIFEVAINIIASNDIKQNCKCLQMSLVYKICDLSVGQNIFCNYQRKYSNHGKPIISGILIVLDYPPKSAINIFSNNQIYCPRHLSFSAMLCLSPSLFLCLSAILISPHTIWFGI
jgi:hypothetical protein